MKNINIALLGAGTVGSGVIGILQENKEVIVKRLYKKTGEEYNISIKKILIRNPSKYPEIPSELVTTTFEDIENDDTINIVVELMGGKQPATDYMLRAMKAGKHVVTANKLAIAQSNGAFEEASKKYNVKFMFEASVAGTIPVVRVIEDSLTANKINRISGIVNGTTNFILTKMEKENLDFDSALKLAQQLGYAEADPSSDIDGDDAMYKIAILSHLAYDKSIDLSNIDKTGLASVTKEDLDNAKENGCTIKYIAESALTSDDDVKITVSPQVLPLTHPLAGVEGATNAVYLYCDNAGEVMLQGQGAGSRPTASAVVSDILNIIENI